MTTTETLITRLNLTRTLVRKDYENELLDFDMTPTGRHHEDSTGALWFQFSDHTQHDTTVWFSVDRADIAGHYFNAAGVAELDEIEELI